jgi:hypothetical protein
MLQCPDDLPEKRPVGLVGLAARQRVAVHQERCIEFGPFAGTEHRLGQREDLVLLDVHVSQIEVDIVLHQGLEMATPGFALSGLAHDPEPEQRMFEFADGLLAAFVVAVQAVEYRVEVRIAPAEFGKEQAAFLGMVQLLRKLVDVEQHGLQRIEVGQCVSPPMLAQQQGDRAQHG